MLLLTPSHIIHIHHNFQCLVHSSLFPIISTCRLPCFAWDILISSKEKLWKSVTQPISKGLAKVPFLAFFFLPCPEVEVWPGGTQQIFLQES